MQDDGFDSNPETDRFPKRTRTTKSKASPSQIDANYVRKLEAELQRVRSSNTQEGRVQSNTQEEPTKKKARKRKRKRINEDDDDEETAALRWKLKAFARVAVQDVKPPTIADGVKPPKPYMYWSPKDTKAMEVALVTRFQAELTEEITQYGSIAKLAEAFKADVRTTYAESPYPDLCPPTLCQRNPPPLPLPQIHLATNNERSAMTSLFRTTYLSNRNSSTQLAGKLLHGEIQIHSATERPFLAEDLVGPLSADPPNHADPPPPPPHPTVKPFHHTHPPTPCN